MVAVSWNVETMDELELLIDRTISNSWMTVSNVSIYAFNPFLCKTGKEIYPFLKIIYGWMCRHILL